MMQGHTMTLPVEDRALSGGADDKAFSPLQQRLQELSPVFRHGPWPRCRGPGFARGSWIDGGEQFVILTDKILARTRKVAGRGGVSSPPWTSAPMTLHNQ